MFKDIPLYKEDLYAVIDNFHLEKLRDKSLLITGATGLIASFLIESLLYCNEVNRTNIKIGALGRSKAKMLSRFGSRKDLIFYEQDVSHKLKIDAYYDYIIHAASNADPFSYCNTPVETMEANLIGTKNILDYSLAQKASRVLFISSAEVYGVAESFEDKPLRENTFGLVDLGSVRSSYPESKRAGEVLCNSYMQQYGISTVCVRPAYVYGPTFTNKSSKADAQFIRNALDGKDIVLKSDGASLRSWIYVSDAVRAMLFVLLEGVEFVYNIAGREFNSIKDFAKYCAEVVGSRIMFENPTDNEKKSYRSVTNSILSYERLESLGFSPKFSLKTGIEHTIQILNEIRRLENG